MNDLTRNLEAILFYYGRPVSKKTLRKLLEIDENSLDQTIRQLQVILSDHGIQLLIHPESIQLVTNPLSLPIIQKMRKDVDIKPLSRSAIEVLALVLYYPSITKSKIDELRGINSAVSIRHLLVKGLIKKDRESGKDTARFIPTSSAMRHLGITDLDQLPKKQELTEFIDGIEK